MSLGELQGLKGTYRLGSSVHTRTDTEHSFDVNYGITPQGARCVIKRPRNCADDGLTLETRTAILAHEAVMLQGTIGSGAVVNLIDQGTGGDKFIAVQYVHGGNMTALYKRGKFQPEVLLMLLMGTTRLVRIYHQSGNVHRDLKPENVVLPDPLIIDRTHPPLLVRVVEGVRLIDLSYSVPSGSTKEQFPYVWNGHTEGFTAPERSPTSVASLTEDIFSHGRTFTEVLSEGHLRSILAKSRPLGRAVAAAQSKVPSKRPTLVQLENAFFKELGLLRDTK